MNRIKILTILLFCLASQQFQAQELSSLTDYFTQVLKGQHPSVVPEERFSLKQIEAHTAQVWQAWKEANQRFNEPCLIALDSLSAAHNGQWQLPDSLEPHAALPYYYGCKGSKPSGGYPLFLYLHGSGPKQQEWATGLTLAQRFQDSPSAYFIPQIPNEGEWYRWWQKSKQFAWARLLRQALLSNDINPQKLYVFGISEGGYGSQRLASFYADYWAAAGPMAGGEPLKNAPVENLENIGFSFRTGANDAGFYRNLLTRYTKEALDSLEALYPSGFRHKVELIPGRQHFIDYSPTTPWLSLFSRTACPTHFIWEDFEMDGLHREGFYNLKIEKRPSDSLRTRYEVNIEGNRVNVVIEDVHYTTTERDPMYGIELKFQRTYTPTTGGEITLFFNSKLVDLSRPIYISINGKRVFNSVAKLDVKNMLRSVATFFDPERIFPVGVRVKY